MSDLPEQAPNLRDPAWWEQDDLRLQAEFAPFDGIPLSEITPVMATQLGALVLTEFVRFRDIIRAECLAPAEPAKPARRARANKVREGQE